MQFTVFWIMNIKTQWIPNIEIHSVNMTKIRTETRQRINEVSYIRIVYLCLEIMSEHV